MFGKSCEGFRFDRMSIEKEKARDVLQCIVNRLLGLETVFEERSLRHLL